MTAVLKGLGLASQELTCEVDAEFSMVAWELEALLAHISKGRGFELAPPVSFIGAGRFKIGCLLNANQVLVFTCYASKMCVKHYAAQKRLNLPHLVKVFDCGVHNGVAWAVLERLHRPSTRIFYYPLDRAFDRLMEHVYPDASSVESMCADTASCNIGEDAEGNMKLFDLCCTPVVL